MAANIQSSCSDRADGDGTPQNGLKIGLGDNARGVLVLAGASVAMVAIAYAAMVALTAPGGWATKVAQEATAPETTATFTVWLGD